MDELIKQALDEYFSDFKEYHLIILIAFTVVIALIQIIQSILVSKKIERFKNELKKSEIRFSKYNQLQIESLSKIYPLLTDLLTRTSIIKNEIDKSSPEKNQKITEDWGKAFNQVFGTFTKEKYILPKEIKSSFGLILQSLIKMNKYINLENNFSSLFATFQNGEVEFMGNDEDRTNISDELEKLKKEDLISKTIKDINELRGEIENYFENIE